MSSAYLARLAERMWAYIDIRGPRQCWPWMGPIVRPAYPYGSFKVKVDGQHCQVPAHRFLWLLEHPLDALPEAVCHRCDNSLCMNPLHLFAGTQADNVRDCIAKKRYSRGEHHPTAKLTEEDVRYIRADARPHKEIAKAYGITVKYVGSIKQRRWWKWL